MNIRLVDTAFEGFNYLVFHGREYFFPQRFCETQDFSGTLIPSPTLK